MVLTPARFGAALFALALLVGPAAAQTPFGGRDSRGYAVSTAMTRYYQHPEEHAPPRAATPAAPAPRYVTVAGPGGTVRRFVLEAPVEVVPFHYGVVNHFPRR